ncbi:MAG: NAD(P)/FAD-dependent oxidoreductase [Granulosicoccus sp.]
MAINTGSEDLSASPDRQHCDVVIIGAGIVGICTAYYLKLHRPQLRVTIVDEGAPMALTSAHSGENYRNWWPHPVMTAFTDYSIDLMESIALKTDNRISLSRRGYALATRMANIDGLVKELVGGYAKDSNEFLRVHDKESTTHYQPSVHADWSVAPAGVDVITNQSLIRKNFPTFDQSIRHVIHVRRAGSLSAQQMGQYMLEQFRVAGGKRLTGRVRAIQHSSEFDIQLDGQTVLLRAQRLVNAAGPFINSIATMLGSALPIRNELQQKIAFEDVERTIPREMPFSIDLDSQHIDWNDEERDSLLSEHGTAWLAEKMPGSIHCRPDGGDAGKWIKLGWAFNQAEGTPLREPELDEAFPEIVLRGATRLNPLLKAYHDRFPRNMHHYGGYYTLTEENWPLIGETAVKGAYVVGAMSGFGTMAACAAGDICARLVVDEAVPGFARALSIQRYDDQPLMKELRAQSSRGIL